MAGRSLQSQDAKSSHVFFRVQAAPSLQTPLNGRLLIFVARGSGDKAVDIDMLHPEATWVAAQEVRDLAPGESIEVDADEAAFPKPFLNLPPGDYEAQAVLDIGHRYPYDGRHPSDWTSGVSSLEHWKPGSGAEPLLVLDGHPPANPQSAMTEKAMTKVRPDVAQKKSS
jgi:hypothetical protein